MDPVIKRVLVDPGVPQPPLSLRVAGPLSFGLFLGVLLWAKYSVPRSMGDRVSVEVYRKQQQQQQQQQRQDGHH